MKVNTYRENKTGNTKVVEIFTDDEIKRLLKFSEKFYELKKAINECRRKNRIQN